MKNIQSILIKAAPQPDRSSSSVDRIPDYIGADSPAKYLADASKHTIEQMRRNWGSMCYLMGLMYRMQDAGYNIMDEIGLTPEERNAAMSAMRLLRDKINTYGQHKNTDIARVYAKVVESDL